MHSPAKSPILRTRSYNVITQCIYIQGSRVTQRLPYRNMENGLKTRPPCTVRSLGCFLQWLTRWKPHHQCVNRSCSRGSRRTSSSGGIGAEESQAGKPAWWWCKRWVKPEWETVGQERTKQRRQSETRWQTEKAIRWKPEIDGVLRAEEEGGEGEGERRCKQSLSLWRVTVPHSWAPSTCYWLTTDTHCLEPIIMNE